MDGIFLFLVPVAVLAVAVVLILGIVNMAKGGSPQRSQKLMQMRVLLQFIAVGVVMVALYFLSSG